MAEIKGTSSREKPSSHDGSKKIKVEYLDKTKSESSKRLHSDLKRKSLSTSVKAEVKDQSSFSKKTITTTSTTTSTSASKTTTSVKVKEKKVYDLPGQRYDIPEEREPLRIFYESLSNQMPSSEMAEIWLMEHGLLSLERAKKAYERKQNRQREQRMGTPVKSPKPPAGRADGFHKSSRNGDLKPRKRLVPDDFDDDDFISSLKKRKV